jgi:hypothetical protein
MGRKKCVKPVKLNMLPGEKFNQWTILQRLPNIEFRDVYYCECVCGTKKPVLGASLRNGHSRSCSCSRAQKDTARNRVLRQYQRNAETRGLVFDLTDAQFDILISEGCFYCGQPPSNHQYTVGYGDFWYTGIDRKDTTVGYLPDNVVSCCFVCNDMKGKMGYDEFLAHIKRILDKHPGARYG